MLGFIRNTCTKTGLVVTAYLDRKEYPTRLKPDPRLISSLALKPAKTLPRWNYQKGALVMFALADYIGEDKVNLGLRNCLQRNRYAKGPFPDTRGFVAALREETPTELQYVITDMFESIVLYENRAVSATYVEMPGGKCKVRLNVSAQKKKADGSGNETPMTIHDLIDIGVFSGTKEHMKRLNMHKEWITQENEIFEMVVDEKPTLAGIDPYNKLNDRNPGNNVMEVEKK